MYQTSLEGKESTYPAAERRNKYGLKPDWYLVWVPGEIMKQGCVKKILSRSQELRNVENVEDPHQTAIVSSEGISKRMKEILTGLSHDQCWCDKAEEPRGSM